MDQGVFLKGGWGSEKFAYIMGCCFNFHSKIDPSSLTFELQTSIIMNEYLSYSRGDKKSIILSTFQTPCIFPSLTKHSSLNTGSRSHLVWENNWDRVRMKKWIQV